MLPKFTPGPWSVSCFLVRDANGERICHTGGTRYVGPTPRPHEAEANARLIAAAPEMYEALADCIVSLCAANLEHLPSLAKARAALAKAEGRDAR